MGLSIAPWRISPIALAISPSHIVNSPSYFTKWPNQTHLFHNSCFQLQTISDHFKLHSDDTHQTLLPNLVSFIATVTSHNVSLLSIPEWHHRKMEIEPRVVFHIQLSCSLLMKLRPLLNAWEKPESCTVLGRVLFMSTVWLYN